MQRYAPAEMWAMWDARIWWWSRFIDVATVLTAVIANRIPFNSKTVDVEEMRGWCPLYVRWKGDEP